MKPTSLTVAEVAQRCKVSESEALEMLEEAERYGLIRRRGDLWFVTQKALRRHFLGRERTTS